jgi:hypothetical protein
MADLLKSVQEFVVAHRKCLGISGDSLTFLGGLLLALEALWKKSERISIAVKKTTAKDFPHAEDAAGKSINPEDTEQKWVNRWHLISQLGAVAMAAGFFVLLLCRIFAE